MSCMILLSKGILQASVVSSSRLLECPPIKNGITYYMNRHVLLDT